MPHRHLLIALLAMLALAVPAIAQVRNAPAGNNLPDDAPPMGNNIPTHADHQPGVATQQPMAAAQAMAITSEARRAFADQLDLDAFRKLAVFNNGRAKIVDTLASERVNAIYGRTKYRDPQTGEKFDPVFTWLDMIFAPGSYFQEPLIHVEVLDFRRAMVSHLPNDEAEAWLQRGRLSPALLSSREAQAIFAGADSDLRLLNGRNQVLTAWAAFDGIQETLVMVSPPPGHDDWLPIQALVPGQASERLTPDGDPLPEPANPEVAQQVVAQFQNLELAWRAQDAAAANAALTQLSDLLPQVHPQTYPSETYRLAEWYYNATHKFTLGYVAYFFAAVLLVIAFRAPRRWLIGTGIALLMVAFATHTAGILVRGLLSGRWPIHNQFESFIAFSWFAALVGLIFMIARRQWLFGAAAAALGFVALMLANTVPIPSHEVGQVAAVLGTSRILYVHVNIVLASYGLISLGFFVSLFYLATWYLPGDSTKEMAAGALNVQPTSPAPKAAKAPAIPGLSPKLAMAGGGSISAADAQAIDVPADSAEGQSDVTAAQANAHPTLPSRSRLLGDLDHAQMVVLQLAFWTLGVGILLGAYWADHAWGRWWAWDPKETWALLTWIVYLAVIHLRFTVKRRGLVTAWLSVLGFFIMLWCYWGVNMFLAGLHSYA